MFDKETYTYILKIMNERSLDKIDIVDPNSGAKLSYTKDEVESIIFSMEHPLFEFVGEWR